MLMGTVTSAPCVAVADKTMADNMFQITPSGSSVECAQNPNVFRVCFSDPDQGAASATYIAENKLADKIAVIYRYGGGGVVWYLGGGGGWIYYISFGGGGGGGGGWGGFLCVCGFFGGFFFCFSFLGGGVWGGGGGGGG